MDYLSGSPLYNYELALAIKNLGHDVSVVSEWHKNLDPEAANLLNNLTASGVHCLGWQDVLPEQDLLICSQLDSEQLVQRFPQTPVINIVHSEYDCESPLPNREQIIKYVCIRHSIRDHLVKEHEIPIEKTTVIYNGVDRTRFKPIKKSKRNYYKIVVPCTLDPIREAFLNKIIDEATEKKRVFLFGMHCGANLHESEWVTISSPKFNIQDEIADADEVAGILLGRVNLEAWSCGVNSSIYDPFTLEHKLFKPPLDFDLNHNIANVAKKLIAISGDLDDITVVIPHHTARPQLAKCLECLRNMKYINIIKGGSFSRNCNVGASLAKTKYILLTNDDTTFNPSILLRQMMLADADICGATPDQGVQGFDINPETKQLELNPKGHYPSGALLLIKKSVYDKLKGLDETFVNGAEDIDIFLRAEKLGYTVKRIDSQYHHDESQSEGRFDKTVVNELLFNKRWRGVCHIGIGE